MLYATTPDEMRKKFSGMSDEALEWLRGGSADVARGGFNTVDDLNNFLNTDPSTLESSALQTGLETILAAMGYRAIHANWAQPPFAPETCEQKKMDRVVQSLVKDHLVAPIGERYLERFTDTVEEGEHLTEHTSVMGIRRAEISEASGEEEAFAPKRLPEKRFRETVGWTSVAAASGVDIRAHVSGTCPLEAASVAGLLEDQAWFDNDKEAGVFLSFLTIPTFHRGDFHSIAETYAGVHHFLQERAAKEGKVSKETKVPVDPRVALKSALQVLKKGIASGVRGPFHEAGGKVISVARKIKYIPSSPSAKDTEKKTKY